MSKIKTSFWKLTLRFSIVFFIFYSIVKTIIKIFSVGFEQMQADLFGPETMYKFLTEIILASVLYGLFMAGYYKFIKK